MVSIQEHPMAEVSSELLYACLRHMSAYTYPLNSIALNNVIMYYYYMAGAYDVILQRDYVL